MLDVVCVARHGSTLRQLGIETATRHHASRPTLADLTSIITSCPRLEGLALHLCSIHLGNIQELGSAFKVENITGELSGTLVTRYTICSTPATA
jgi:hypothetical protein